MNIGIDIDGVLTDLESMILENGTKLCVEENLPIQIDASQYDVCKMFNWTEEQEEKFWNKYIVNYFKNSNPRAFSKEIIDKLIEEGNQIYLITARNEDGVPSQDWGKVQEITKKWLEKNNIKYTKLIFAKDEDKLSKCIENNVSIMIEDSPKNIQNISTKLKVIKFNNLYNENANGNNIETAYSWYHVYDIINKK